VAFAKSSSLSSELERLAPTGPDQRWVGYISNPVNYSTGGPQSFTATASFSLVQGSDGASFPRPLRHRAVAGSRISQGNLAPTRPVTCGQTDLTAVSADSSTVCANSPPAGTIATDDAFKTRDAGVLASSARATAAPKSLAALPFTIRYSGAGGDDAPRLSLSASTTLREPHGHRARGPPGVPDPRGAGDPQPAQPGRGRHPHGPAPGAISGADVRITAATAKARPSGFLQIRGTATRALALNLQIKRRGRAESQGPPAARPGRHLPLDQGPRGVVPQARRDPRGLPAAGHLRHRGRAAHRRRDRPPRRTARVKLPAPANFRFAAGALPARGPAFRPSIQWFRNGKAIGLETRPRRRSLSAFLRLRDRRPLPTGRYRAVLKTGREVVAVAEVRIG